MAEQCWDLTLSPKGYYRCPLEAGHETDPLSLHEIMLNSPRLPKYYVTFGSQYTPRNQIHPYWGPAHADGYVMIEADTEPQARELVVQHFKSAWSNIYSTSELTEDHAWFRLGEIGRITADGVLHDARERQGTRV